MPDKNSTKDNEFSVQTSIVKVDESLGLVLGWGIICTEDGEPYVDTQDDHISETEMLKAATDFMLNSRATDDMHDERQDGAVVFAWPMTAEVAAAFKMDLPATGENGELQSGLMLGVKPSAAVLAKFRSGEYTGFSLGGFARRVPADE